MVVITKNNLYLVEESIGKHLLQLDFQPIRFLLLCLQSGFANLLMCFLSANTLFGQEHDRLFGGQEWKLVVDISGDLGFVHKQAFEDVLKMNFENGSKTYL